MIHSLLESLDITFQISCRNMLIETFVKSSANGSLTKTQTQIVPVWLFIQNNFRYIYIANEQCTHELNCNFAQMLKKVAQKTNLHYFNVQEEINKEKDLI